MAVKRAASVLRRGLPRPLWDTVRAVGTAIYTPIQFSLRTGHWRSSLKSIAQSRTGVPIPWYTYPAIDFLQQRDFTARSVLEFGGGQSTLWWANRAERVLTIEEDQGWFAQLLDKVPENVSLHHIPADTQSRSIEDVLQLIRNHAGRPFDVVVIDGHLRRELLAASFDLLTPQGAIIFDNSDGYGFYEEVSARPCRRVDFFGFAPGVSARHCTSLVYVDDCFLLDPRAPLHPPEQRDREIA